MHELSLVREMLKLAENELTRKYPEGKVGSITLRVGRLSGAHPEALRFAFDTISPHTKLADARLIIKESRARFLCKNCQIEGELDELVLECPQCHSDNIILEGGRELLLESMEVDNEKRSK